MRADEFILQTLAHFARGEEGPPPGVPARIDADFERDLVRFCEWHGLAPLVLASLKRLALEPALSEFGIQHLKTLAKRVSTRNAMLLEAVDELTVGFRREGVSFLLSDDVASALSLYPSEGLRPIDQIDLLVRDWDWRGIVEACGGAGFARSPTDPAFTSAGEALFYYQHFGPLIMKNPRGIRIRLRFRLFDLGAPEPSETAWSHTETIEAPSGARERIGLEDLLVRSCVQLAMSRFERILAAVDAGRILTQHGGKLDWEYIRTKSQPIYPAFYITSQKIAEWLNTPGVSARFLPPGRTRGKIFRFMWRTRRFSRLARRRPHRHRLRFYVLENVGLRERLDFLATLVTPRREWVATFFGCPCRPWLRARYTYLAFKEKLEQPSKQGKRIRYGRG
ncbi:MAG: nucleotidyltransferase family protein [bacterium]